MSKSAAQVRFHDEHPSVASLLEGVLTGFATRPKVMSPKFFYDQRGSELFDVICGLPEYYPTRTEISILQRFAKEIGALAGTECLLVELGSGASKKVRLLLEALRPAAYMGVDISREFLLQSTRKLAADYPWLEVHARCADFSRGLTLSSYPPGAKTLAFFPGSSIGNFTPREAVEFMRSLRELLLPDGALVVGVDLKKDPAILNAAYNDAQGITAAFNLNLLTRIRRELGVQIDINAFEHRAFYNANEGCVEMHLVSRTKQKVKVGNQCFLFDAGESIRTEHSYKYTVEEFQELGSQAGYQVVKVWTDPARWFSVQYLTADRG